MADDDVRASDVMPGSNRSSDQFQRIIPPPTGPFGTAAPWGGLRRRWQWLALGLAAAVALTFLAAPINGPLGSPFLRVFRHTTIPDPSYPSDRSLGGSAPSDGGVSSHQFSIDILTVRTSSNAWRLRVAMTNRGATPVLAEAGTTATLTIGGHIVSTVNPEASRNDFYTAINPGQTVTGWLEFPMTGAPTGQVDLTIPHLFRLNTPFWTARVPVR